MRLTACEVDVCECRACAEADEAGEYTVQSCSDSQLTTASSSQHRPCNTPVRPGACRSDLIGGADGDLRAAGAGRLGDPRRGRRVDNGGGLGGALRLLPAVGRELERVRAGGALRGPGFVHAV